MKNTFLVGSFLPAYSSVFRYNNGPAVKKFSFSTDLLAARFEARTERIRTKGSGYTLKFQLGLIAALFLTSIAFTVPFSLDGKFEITEVDQELVTMEEIMQTKQQILPPPPPRPAIPLAVPDDEVLEQQDLDLDAALELDEAIINLPPPPPVEEEAPAEPEIFVVVETMPQIKGGLASLVEAVKYPTIARENGIEGNVIVKVVVTEEGLPLNPVIVRSPSPLLDKAALEAVMKLRFEPGRQRGRAVRVEMVIPVKFRLTD